MFHSWNRSCKFIPVLAVKLMKLALWLGPRHATPWVPMHDPFEKASFCKPLSILVWA